MKILPPIGVIIVFRETPAIAPRERSLERAASRDEPPSRADGDGLDQARLRAGARPRVRIRAAETLSHTAKRGGMSAALARVPYRDGLAVVLELRHRLELVLGGVHHAVIRIPVVALGVRRRIADRPCVGRRG